MLNISYDSGVPDVIHATLYASSYHTVVYLSHVVLIELTQHRTGLTGYGYYLEVSFRAIRSGFTEILQFLRRLQHANNISYVTRQMFDRNSQPPASLPGQPAGHRFYLLDDPFLSIWTQTSSRRAHEKVISFKVLVHMSQFQSQKIKLLRNILKEEFNAWLQLPFEATQAAPLKSTELNPEEISSIFEEFEILHILLPD